jgi:hypothetical protein
MALIPKILMIILGAMAFVFVSAWLEWRSQEKEREFEDRMRRRKKEYLTTKSD